MSQDKSAGLKADEKEEWLTLGLAATLNRRYTADQKVFLETLAGTLQRSLPGHVQIRRKGWFLTRIRPVHKLGVTLGDHCYELENPGHGALRAKRLLYKRGIALATDELSMEEWIRELCAAIESHAAHNRAAAEALKRLAG
jgi:hypothetical protein